MGCECIGFFHSSPEPSHPTAYFDKPVYARETNWSSLLIDFVLSRPHSSPFLTGFARIIFRNKPIQFVGLLFCLDTDAIVRSVSKPGHVSFIMSVLTQPHSSTK